MTVNPLGSLSDNPVYQSVEALIEVLKMAQGAKAELSADLTRMSVQAKLGPLQDPELGTRIDTYA